MWYAKNSASSGQGIVIDEQTGRSVAVAYDEKDTALLAAAPELLGTLQAMVNVFSAEKKRDPRICSAAVQQARAAIAKATGHG